MAKIGRNDPCPCGSGKKYKRCCGKDEGAAFEVKDKPLDAGATRPDRRALERDLAHMGALLREKGFRSPEEANAYLKEITSGNMKVPPPSHLSPLEEAQEMMYDAWETSGPKRSMLAQRAIEKCPDCADAYVLLAEESKSIMEALSLYLLGVAAGERAIGQEGFAGWAGSFWGVIETRPYMRACQGLADVLWGMGAHRLAIDQLDDMLWLNPGDNQGVRYILLSWLLQSRDYDEAHRLLNSYKEDIAAEWDYGRALYTFATRGDSPAARKALEKAKRTNRYVPSYLLGRRPTPKRLPEYVRLGDESEAVATAAEFLPAWEATPGALAWLREQEGGGYTTRAQSSGSGRTSTIQHRGRSKDEPSYPDIVIEVMRSAPGPLTFDEILERVNRIKPVDTKNPKSTIRNVFSQTRLLPSIGDGRRGYLPNLLKDNTFRHTLSQSEISGRVLEYEVELMEALWPRCFEIQKRVDHGAAQFQLRDGAKTSLELEYQSPKGWVSRVTEPVAKWFSAQRVKQGDDLLFHVVDAEARKYAVSVVRSGRDGAAIAARDKQTADSAFALLREDAWGEKFLWEIGFALIARGLYRDPVPPHSLERVLKADHRFVVGKYDNVILAGPRESDSIQADRGGAWEKGTGSGKPASPAAILDFRLKGRN